MLPQKMPFQPGQIKAILFDLDDTLWPVAPTIMRAETVQYEWLAQHAPRLVAMHTRDAMRARRMELAQNEPRLRHDLWSLRHIALQEALTAAGEDLALADTAMEIFSRERNVVSLFDDVLPGLQLLGQRYVLGSISNGFADVNAVGLGGHFKVSVAAHRMGFGKPDARIFHHACEALQVEPHQTVYVGDDPLLDVEGAQQAGLHAVWMDRFGRELPAQVKPDGHCRGLHELPAYLGDFP